MGTVTEYLLKEITGVIVNAVNPVKVILFGSYARGTAGSESDLDFLIIEEQPIKNRRKEIGNIHRHLRAFRIPIDILVYGKGEFEQWSNSINHVLAYADREGRVLYERG